MKNFLFTTLFAIVSVLAFSQERIAVFPFENPDNVLNRNQAFMFYDRFSDEFATRNAGRFIVVPRQLVLVLDQDSELEGFLKLQDFFGRNKERKIFPKLSIICYT